MMVNPVYFLMRAGHGDGSSEDSKLTSDRCFPKRTESIPCTNRAHKNIVSPVTWTMQPFDGDAIILRLFPIPTERIGCAHNHDYELANVGI